MKLVLALASLLAATAVSAAPSPAVKWTYETPFNVGYLGNHLAVDDTGATFMAGSTAPGSAGSCMTVVKNSGVDGTLLWKKETCGAFGFGYSVALDAQQNPVVAGYVGTKMRVAKLNSGSGAPVWEQEFARDSVAVAFHVSVIAGGDLIVVGTRANTSARHTSVFRLRGDNGNIVWEATVNNGVDDNYGTAEVGADGTVIVATRSVVSGHAYWAVMKYTPAGALAWTRMVTTADGQPTALAMDGAGDVYVGGVFNVLNPQVTDAYVLKLAAADGATIWTRDFSAASYNDYITRMRLDGAGSLYITGGHQGAFFTAKLSAASGATAWDSHFAAEEFGDDAGLDIAFDPAGDVIVTGDSFYQAVQQARTIKYSAATGQRIWMRTDDSTRLGLGANVLVRGSAIYLISSMGTPGVLAKVIKLDSTLNQPDANSQGLWWKAPAGAESGWGMNFVQQGNIVFMTWFTYDTDNSPLWFVVTNGDRVEGNLYRGKLYRTTGPAFNSVPFDPAQVHVTEVGVATFEFDDNTNGVFHFKINGTRYTHAITRQVYATPLPTCELSTAPRAQNYQDLWWAAPAGVESGWGMNLTHQQDILFATWFTYGQDGKPLWLVGSDVRRVPGTDRYTGKVYQTRGSAYNQVFNPTKFSIQEVGNMTLTFTGPNAATFDYTVNGITQSKAITRQDFANPPTVCH